MGEGGIGREEQQDRCVRTEMEARRREGRDEGGVEARHLVSHSPSLSIVQSKALQNGAASITSSVPPPSPHQDMNM